MNLVSPIHWWWLLLALPIILFYILRTRLRKQPVATLLFWVKLFDEKRQRSLWNRLRHWASLLLQLAFLGLVVTALVDPLWSGQRENARQVVIVLDNSASMQTTTTDGTTRFEAACESAMEILSGLRDGDEIALMTAGSTERVVVGMTDFAPAIRDAIREIDVTDGPTRVREAIDTARRLTRSPDRREIVVISDFCFDAPELLDPSKDLRLVAIGQSVENAAITSLAVRRSLVDPIGYSALVVVKNFGESNVECRLTFQLDGALVDVIPIQIPAGGTVQKTIVKASADGGILSAQIRHDDGLAIDNQALAVLPRRPPIEVVLVTDEPSVYLESVLKAIPLVDLSTTSEVPEAAPENGFVVLHRVAPATLPTGRVLAIDPQSDSQWWKLGDEITQAIVAKQDPESPLLPHVQLLNVSLPGARALDVDSNATPLLTDASGATLMASVVRGEDRVVVLATNLDDGDLPLRIAFPVLMTNAVNWFLHRTGELQRALGTGELAEISSAGYARDQSSQNNESSQSNEWAWMDAADNIAPATRGVNGLLVGPADHVGIMHFGPRKQLQRLADDAGDGDRGAIDTSELERVAVNLASASESDLRPRVEIASSDPAFAGSGRRSIWFYLTLVALGLIVGEWFLYQRRIVG